MKVCVLFTSLPSEPRHLCFVYVIGIVVVLSIIVTASAGVSCTNVVCQHNVNI